jgi:hypothetical protein
MPDFPTFTDGRRAPRQPIVKCWNILSSNLPVRFHWLSDDIKTSGMSVDHIIESSGEHVGGFAGASARKGNLTLLLDNADDAVPQPGHVISLQKGAVTEWYKVDESSAPNQGKNQVTITLTVTRLIHPLFTGLLSEDEGDLKRVTYSIASMNATETITAAPVNTRSGATLTCALAAEGESAALPAGVAIDATTGVITITKASVVAGTYYIDVTCQDVLANKRTLKGGCHLVLTITA